MDAQSVIHVYSCIVIELVRRRWHQVVQHGRFGQDALEGADQTEFLGVR